MARCRRAAAAALAASGIAAPSRDLEVSVVLTDDAEIRDLNRTYRHRDEATNVLAFAALEGGAEAAGARPPEGAPLVLGDVVVALESTRREAIDQGKSLGGHLSHLVVHGVLHLLGHDHASAAEAEAMEGLEKKILAELDVPDPYAARPLVAS
jgi:probable rRNA maturation factor